MGSLLKGMRKRKANQTKTAQTPSSNTDDVPVDHHWSRENTRLISSEQKEDADFEKAEDMLVDIITSVNVSIFIVCILTVLFVCLMYIVIILLGIDDATGRRKN